MARRARRVETRAAIEMRPARRSPPAPTHVSSTRAFAKATSSPCLAHRSGDFANCSSNTEHQSFSTNALACAIAFLEHSFVRNLTIGGSTLSPCGPLTSDLRTPSTARRDSRSSYSGYVSKSSSRSAWRSAVTSAM
ncbi:hypothetical protein IG631_10953 [Alternaria alternata]|nr:hypothetical protein IG631_10953 [Alternaria alternata]